MSKNKDLIKKRGTVLKALAKKHGGWYCHYCGIILLPITHHYELYTYEFRGRTFLLTEDNVFTDTATIDHYIPRSAGGSNDLSNLVICCRYCNSAKNDRSAAEFLAYIEATQWYKFISGEEQSWMPNR